jgi:hypothetical protein
MASIISASTTSGTALNMSGDTSGVLQLATGATPTTAVTIDTSQNVTLAGTLAMSSSFLRNRIINGDMRIDQRNAGASITPASGGGYSLDRWQYVFSQSSKFNIQQNAGSVTPPVGFKNYLGLTVAAAVTIGSGDYFYIGQKIEGFNAADLGWGTADAKTVTLSFWVRSSLTGTFGGSFTNADNSRSYPFTYTISSANTWTIISVTVAGDTSGTWLTTNGIGISVIFGLGLGSTYSGTAGAWATADYRSATGAVSVVGTSGATWYVTGTQLEIGTSATPFERRLYNQELANCQRYYYKIQASTAACGFGVGYSDSTTAAYGLVPFPVTLRTRPTALEQSGTASHYRINASGGNITCSAVPTYDGITDINTGCISYPVASGLTAGRAVFFIANSTSAYLAWSAEL